MTDDDSGISFDALDGVSFDAVDNPVDEDGGISFDSLDDVSFDSIGDSPDDESRTWGEAAGDTWASFAAGSNALLESAGNIYGLATGEMDNWASLQGASGREYWNERKSDHLIALEGQRKSRIDAAEGVVGKAGVAFWDTITTPELLTSFIFEQVPMLLPSAGAGRAAAGAARVAGASSKTAGKVGTGAAVGTGAVMQGADAGSQAYEQLMAIPDEVWQQNEGYQSMVGDGAAPEVAKHQIAHDLSQNAAIASGLISVGTNMIPGARYLEAKLAGAKLPGTSVQKLILGGAGEATQEGIEEGAGVASANYFTSLIDPEQSLSEGVGEAAGLGATAGAFGIGAGAVDIAQSVGEVGDRVGEAVAKARGGIDNRDIDLGDLDLGGGEGPQGDGSGGGAPIVPDTPAPAGTTEGDFANDDFLPNEGEHGRSSTPNPNLTDDGVEYDPGTGEVISRQDYEAHEQQQAVNTALSAGQEVDLSAPEAASATQAINLEPEIPQQDLPPISAYEEPAPQPNLFDQPETEEDRQQELAYDRQQEFRAAQEPYDSPAWDAPLEQEATRQPETDSASSEEPAEITEVDLQAHQAATSPANDLPDPTPAQIEAGNYKKGHIKVAGLDIAIENPKGSERSGTDPDGNEWSVTMQSHYGYIKRTNGADGDHVDVFVGDQHDSQLVYIIDQVDANGVFDEHKVMLGFPSEKAAVEAYKANYEEGWTVGPVSEVSSSVFDRWLAESDTTKPYSPAGIDILEEDNQFQEASEAEPDQEAAERAPESTSAAVTDDAEEMGLAPEPEAPLEAEEVPRDVEVDGDSSSGQSGGQAGSIEPESKDYRRGYLARKKGKPRRIPRYLNSRSHGERSRGIDEYFRGWLAADAEAGVSEVSVKPTRRKTSKGPSMVDRLRNYFVPGRIVEGYAGQDRVIEFRDLGDSRWEVDVEAADADGNTTGPKRTHSTAPDARKLKAWEKENPVAASEPVESQAEEPAEIDDTTPPEEAAPQGRVNEAGRVQVVDGELMFPEEPDPVPEARQELDPEQQETNWVEELNEKRKQDEERRRLQWNMDLPARPVVPTAAAERWAEAKVPGGWRNSDNDESDTIAGFKAGFILAVQGQATYEQHQEASLNYDGTQEHRTPGYKMGYEEGLKAIENGEKPPRKPKGGDSATLSDQKPEESDNAQLDQAGESTPGGIQAEGVRESEVGGDAGQDAEQPSATDGGGGRSVGGERAERGRSTANDPGDVSVPSAGVRSDSAPGSGGLEGRGPELDFTITSQEDIASGGDKTKFRNNIAAIRLLKELESEGRQATPEEQATLAKYVGWGGLPQAFFRESGGTRKGWESEADQLKDVLTEDEYAAARRSTQDAHYTSTEIIEGMYAGLDRLGFKSGRVLEPSMGAGNFFGMMPKDMRETSDLTGVELDHITGGIAKQLYNSADIHAPVGFQDFSMADAYFDLAIGNPPFGSQLIYDKHRPDISKFSIHNYFFGKSIAGLRPGGVLAMVVSNSFLDKVGKKQRQHLATQAEFVGAIRLPNNAFKANAGTEVTTDIIFMRKLEDGEVAADMDWVGTTRTTGADGVLMRLNNYFIQHPEMMLGEMRAAGSMYRADEPALIAREGQNTAELLQGAISRLPEGIYREEVRDLAPVEDSLADIESGDAVTHAPINGMFVREDGQLMTRLPDVNGNPVAVEQATKYNSKGEEVPLKDREVERLTGMVGMASTLSRLLQGQLTDATDTQLQDYRDRLNEQYDAFSKKNGFIDARVNKGLFRDDPMWPRLAALEVKYDAGVSAAVAKKNGQQARKPSAQKADIFNTRTQMPYTPVTRVGTAKEGLVVSLSQRGRLDLDHIQDMTGMDQPAVVEELKGLIYHDPVDGWVTAEEYLSGNVKRKLRLAQAAADEDAQFADNVTALKKVIPEDIEAVDISVKIGAPWISPAVMTAFVDHLAGEPIGAQFSYAAPVAKWSLESSNRAGSNKLRAEWGTSDRTALELIMAAANNKIPTVTRKDSDGKNYTDKDATDAAQAKLNEIKLEFEDWLWADADRREKLAAVYNDGYNTTVGRDYDGSHLELPGQNRNITLRPHQSNFIWRVLQSQSTLADHVVGAGKTFALIGAAMELRRTGLSKKPMLVVPNHLVQQWANDFMLLYPNANILVPSKRDFAQRKRRELFGRIATGDWDAVIVAHSSFKKLPSDPVEEEFFIKQQIKDLKTSVESLRASQGKGDRSTKELEKAKERMENRLKEMADVKDQDDGLNFSELGVDSVFVDEAHEYKNLAYQTSMTRVAGLGNTGGSQKASDMFIKTQSVLNRKGRVVFATGTPVSNSIAEKYTIQRYLGYAALREQGLAHFDAWANIFGEVVTDTELDATGVKYKMNSRFNKFVNLPELLRQYFQFADVIDRDDINAMLASRGEKLPIPRIKGEAPQNIIVPRSSEIASYMDLIVSRAETMSGKDPSEDNMLKVTNDARKAALDIRLIDPLAGDSPDSKTNYAVEQIMRLYHQWTDVSGTQLVFLDLSTPKGAVAKERAALEELREKAAAGDDVAATKLGNMSPDEVSALESSFSVYDDMRAKLIAQGIPDQEVAFIHDANTDERKAALFEKVNRGEVRVLMGSTAKMGAGMNVQERLVGLHHMDAPWKPSDLEQREGRIIRQGNKLYDRDPDGFEIEILRYATEMTYDARMWQTIEGKARFIEQLRNGDLSIRVIEDIAGQSASAAEMKAEASGNPLIMEEFKLRSELKKLEGLKKQHDRKQWGMESELRNAERKVDYLPGKIQNLERDLETMNSSPFPKDDKGEPVFTIQIGGREFQERPKAGDALMLKVHQFMKSGKDVLDGVGTFRGLELGLSRVNAQSFSVDLTGLETYSNTITDIEKASESGLITRISNLAQEIHPSLVSSQSSLKRAERDVSELKGLSGAEFKQEEELKAVRARHSVVVRELSKSDEDREDERQLASANAVKGGEIRRLVEGKTGAPVMYNRKAKVPDIDTDFALEILSELAQVDELFRYPISNARTVDVIIEEVAGPHGFRYAGTDNTPDPEDMQGADDRHLVMSPDNSPVWVYTTPGEVWTNVSRLKGDGSGSAIYAALANYAYRSGRKFIGDPAGLSEDAVIRRTSNMLSSALQYGTARHLEPGAEQLRGIPERGVLPLEWSGGDVDKLKALVETFVGTQLALNPDLDGYSYDFRERAFTDPAGQKVTTRLLGGAKRRGARAARAGTATLRRAVLIKSLLSETDQGRQGEIFARVLDRANSLIDSGDLRALFRKTTSPSKARKGMPPGKLRLIVNGFLKKYPGLNDVNVKVVESAAELPGVSTADLAKFEYSAAYEPATDTLYLVSRSFQNRAEVIESLQEELLVHKGLGILKPEQVSALVGQILALAEDVPEIRAIWDQVQRDYPGQSEQVQAEEVIAKIAHERLNPVRRAWNRFVMWFRRLLARAGLVRAGASKREVLEVIYRMGDAFRRGRRARPRTPGTSDEETGSTDAIYNRKAKEPGEKPKRKSRAERDAEWKERKEREVGVRGRILRAESASDAEARERTRTQLVKDWGSDLLSDQYKGFLGAIPREYLPDFAPEQVTALKVYVHDANAMDARRNNLMGNNADVVDQWEKYARGNSEGNRALADLMYQTTLAGVDPSQPYKPLITEEEAERRIKVEQEKARTAPGDSKLGYFRNIKKIKNLVAQEANRKKAKPILKALWRALDGEAQAIYEQARDAYREQRALMFQALISRIERAEVADAAKGNLMDLLRMELETQTVAEPYFPLQRFGDYWVSIFDDDILMDYQMFEKQSGQVRFIEQAQRQGLTVYSGRHSKANDVDGAANAKLASAITDLAGDLHPDVAKSLQDDVWQVYLSMLPELSTRKKFIHRKKIPGYNEDALRAFAHNMFHGSHQLSKLEWRDVLETHLDNARAQTRKVPDLKERNQATVLVDEMHDRHQWAMDPRSSPLATGLTALGFAWYLGASVASAAVNLTQTVQIGYPVLGARFGYDKAAAKLASASRDILISGADSLTGAERIAFNEFLESGVVDKTQAHDLAGVAEYGENYLTAGHKAMSAISWLFHLAEKLNREVTALAAYRLAKGEMGHDQAVDYAKDAVWMSHYNYSNANRPRYMQNDFAKVLLLFKQYSVNTTYRLARDLNDSLRGQSNEVKRLARRRFAGIQMMTAVLGGIPAMWGVSWIAAIVSVMFDWDDDEPYEPETEFRAFLAESLGPTASDMIMTGAVDTVSPVSISQRISLSDLWIRDVNRDMDGSDLWEHRLSEMAGPVPRIVHDGLRGLERMQEGYVSHGVEIMAPTAIENLLKAMRYNNEGVTNWRKDEIVPVDKLSSGDLATQALGFTPSKVNKRYAQNSAIMLYQQKINNRRSQLMARYWLAMRLGDEDQKAETVREMRDFSRKNPGKAITPDQVRSSMRSRARASVKMENGMPIDPGLEHLIDELDFGE